MLPCPEGGLCAVAQIQLAEDIRDVVLDRALGDEERLADLAVARAARQEAENLALAVGQFVRSWRAEGMRLRRLG